jgi:chorismate mutase/prephenate dehydrogenase
MTEPPGDSTSLTSLRDRLAGIDTSLLELVAQRQALVTEIGRIKSAAGRQTRDYAQEKEVVNRARRSAATLGLNANLAEELLLLLIRASLTAQEQDRVQASGEGGGRRVLIIGGAGKMGRWLARFLASQGFAVEVADPAAAGDELPHIADWHASALEHDIIVVAAPLRTSCTVLEELAVRRPRGLVFDIGSLKTPLRPGLLALQAAGVAVTSVHPMFGPDTELLSGRHVIFVDVGHADATRRARELFASTMAVQVEMDLDSHDRLVAYILGLSHAVNIAFFTALAESGEKAQRLAQLSSTTFDSQLEVARRVAAENPHLYYEIQSLNEYGEESLSALLSAVERLHASVKSGDEATFTAMMERGAQYLAAHAERTGRG